MPSLSDPIVYVDLMPLCLGLRKSGYPGLLLTSGSPQFYIRGVDYQPGGQSDLTDPLADVENCKRDIPIFKELGLNAVRICK